MAPGMDARQMVQYFMSNEGDFNDKISGHFKTMICNKTEGWTRNVWSILIERLTREAWAITVTEQGSARQIFYAELAAYAEGVHDERLKV